MKITRRILSLFIRCQQKKRPKHRWITRKFICTCLYWNAIARDRTGCLHSQ